MLLQKIKNTVKKYNLINKRDRIVAGVSGGPDSLALLFLLDQLRGELGFGLIVAHLDHALRKESAIDAAFVGGAAAKLGLPFFFARLKAGKLSSGGSVEEAARNARLDFLCKIAKENKANKIALGHHFDDQAETVLMRILRGTGLYGLAGILPKRNIKGFVVIRPLIELKRSQIEAFLKVRGARPRRDASNKDDIYFRNKIRNKLLPLLEKEYNLNIREVLVNMSDSAACDYDYLRRAAGSVLPAGVTSIGLNRFVNMHQALRRLVVRNIFGALKGDTRRITFRHINEVEDMALNRPTGSVVDLPSAVSVVKKKDCLYFYHGK